MERSFNNGAVRPRASSGQCVSEWRHRNDASEQNPARRSAGGRRWPRRSRSRLAPARTRTIRQASAGNAAPGSQQDFVVNVGDRVFFETDSTDLTPQSRATLDKQAQWLTRYAQYAFTIEGHADERGTREYNHRARRPPRADRARLSDLARHRGQPHAHHLLRQGAAGGDLRRHFLLVAEPPRGHGAQREFVSRLWIRRPGTLGA